ncbi:2-oxo acid dehydrogenase subunit E2 [Actinomadura madurae]|uniref:dihydrolipoamide acetyltransferase family protein n=1 Tax=Actinomadura madurae TaxID=1993 RepID=UPI0020271EAA|nr:dihydrolipoamide acetyltransferase family protein [Actinomadura madurae]URN09749.1 2-oxo acid dehydrogenase subunit E2 [Actinomadura madurae]
MTEAHQFALPDVGEGLTEAEIVKWHVQPGDTVAVNDTLVEVETAKSLVELPSPHGGVVAGLHAAEGETVAVGSVLVSFGNGAAPEEERQPVLVGYGAVRESVARRPRKPGYRVPAQPSTPSTPSTPGTAPDKPYATPPVRLRARQLGIDLVTVTPTGSRGQITRADLEAAARTTANTAESEGPTEERIPIKGIRKATAEAMVSSAFTAPHVTEWVTVDVTGSLTLLDELRADRAFADARLTPLVLIARAVLFALRAHPGINAKWDAEANEIVRYRDVNLGIATATPRGLLVPNIKAAQKLSTRELCDALSELITRAREGKTPPETMARGTFTITNIGVFGVDGGTPILNPGEAGILGVGQISRRPWEHQGEVTLRSVCTLSLSFDHRLVDGQLGSEVLAHVARLLAQPSLALVH